MNRAELVSRLTQGRPGVHLTVIQVDALTSPDQRFRCEPYRAVIRASVCMTRQQQHGRVWRLNGYGARVGETDTKGRGTTTADFGFCKNCPLGRRVVERLS